MARPQDGKTGSEALARIVRERREELGLSRQELAEATGIPYPTIAQIETAYRGVSPARLGVIARVLGLDPKELYDVLASDDAAAGPPPAARRPPLARSRAMRAGPGAPAPAAESSGEWHTNARFAGADRASFAAPAPMDAASPMAAPASMAAGAAPLRQEPQPPEVVQQVVELLSALPADERIDALSRAQSLVLDQIVRERVEESWPLDGTNPRLDADGNVHTGVSPR